MEAEKKNGGEIGSREKRTVHYVNREGNSQKAESIQLDATNKNKVNLAEMILNATNRQIEDKKSIESKATGYLAFAALILTMISDSFPGVIGETKDNCPLFSSFTFVLFILTFIAGVGLIIICALILSPKEISYFTPESLLDLYQKTAAKGMHDKIDASLIQGNEKSITTNTATLKRMDLLNQVASIFLMILIIIFVIDVILYFVFLGVQK